MERRLRLGVIGCSDVAWRRALPAACADPAIELIAVASRRPGRAREFAQRFGAEVAGDYAALLSRDDVDAVYVPLPVALHAPWIEAALEAGKHVLAEKPMTTGPRTTERLIKLARDRGRTLLENFMFLFHSQHDAVRRLVAGGAIGEPRVFSAAFTIPALPAGDIRHQPALGGGSLLDVGGYPLRAARLLLGDDLKVAGAALRPDPALGVDVGGAALLTTPDGVQAHITFGMRHSYRSRYEVWGEGGGLILDRAFTTPADHRPVVRHETPEGVREIVLDADDQWANVFARFAAAALTGDPLDDLADATLHHADLVERLRMTAH